MSELIKAIEAAIRNIVREEFIQLVDKMDIGEQVLDAVENHPRVTSAIDDIVTTAIDDHDFNSAIEKACKNMTYEVRVY